MKNLLTACASILLLAGLAIAASIDGKWVSERKMDRDGQSFTIIQTFDLKESAGKLTGKIMMQFGDMEPRTSEVKDGKIDGSKFSFSTEMQGQNGSMKMTYNGTVEGDTLKGTAEREGGQARPFEAKRK
jgi:hypothetical protein